jgi:hypothetical protein
MIVRLSDLLHIFASHVAPESRLNFDDQSNLLRMSESISCVLIEARVLDIIVINLTIAAAT